MARTDLALSFLPLAHVYERLTDYGYLFRGIPLAYVARPEDVAQALVEVRPTFAAAVPRFFEKLYATVMERGAQATGLRRHLFDWAISVARAAFPGAPTAGRSRRLCKLQWELADRLVYKNFAPASAGACALFISGGAPLATALAEFFTAVGLTISQGYGLTETSPVVSNNIIAANHIGTVGHPIRGVEVRIADDGEILVRGPCVMMGYYKKPEETREVISPDGWLATGDIGHLDKDGYLIITDRKKELLKTAGGKLVAPAPIENALKTSPYIQNAALVGDKRRFIAALIVPNFTTVEARAREKGVTFASPADLPPIPGCTSSSKPKSRASPPTSRSTKPSSASPCSNATSPSTAANSPTRLSSSAASSSSATPTLSSASTPSPPASETTAAPAGPLVPAFGPGVENAVEKTDKV